MNYADMKSQQDRVLYYIKQYGSITSNEAKDDLSVSRLADVMWKLKNKGWIWDKATDEGKNKFDEPCTFARYTIDPADLAEWKPRMKPVKP